jgi:hypothetical protein
MGNIFGNQSNFSDFSDGQMFTTHNKKTNYYGNRNSLNQKSDFRDSQMFGRYNKKISKK